MLLAANSRCAATALVGSEPPFGGRQKSAL
jgi:hypothetical protein